MAIVLSSRNHGLTPSQLRRFHLDTDAESSLGDDDDSETPSMGKRKPSAASSVGGMPKKAKKSIETRWGPMAPGFGNGLLIDFEDVGEICMHDAKFRGYPKVVDLSTFTPGANKANFSMADVVATLLWKYDPAVLKEFLNVKEKANFTFIRKDSNPRKNDFIISRTGDLGDWSIHTAMVCEYLHFSNRC